MNRPDELLARLARAERPDEAQTARFFSGWHTGATDDAQVAAWCMACNAAGYGADAVPGIVEGLVAGGKRIEADSIGPSATVCTLATVGDPGPLGAIAVAAACGVTVPYLCGRGVGDYGGDADRLRAIPGLTGERSLGEFVADLRASGLAVAGTVGELAPRRDRLAGLQERIGLGGDSALSLGGALAAAVAAGAGGLVVVLPYGRGAAVERGEVADLAAAAHRVGERWQRRVEVIEAHRDELLVGEVGHRGEMAALAAVLRGDDHGPLRAWVLQLAAAMIECAGVAAGEEAKETATAALEDQSACEQAEQWVDASGGDSSLWRGGTGMPPAPVVIEVLSERAGEVSDVDPGAVGAAARWVGAGRLHPDQAIDLSVGVELAVGLGDAVAVDQVVARVHGRDEGLADTAAIMVARAISVDGRPLEDPPNA